MRVEVTGLVKLNSRACNRSLAYSPIDTWTKSTSTRGYEDPANAKTRTFIFNVGCRSLPLLFICCFIMIVQSDDSFVNYLGTVASRVTREGGLEIRYTYHISVSETCLFM